METILDCAIHPATQIATAMERNMVGHMSYAAERLPSATVLTGDGLTLVDAGVATDTFNVVCGATLDAELADSAIHSAVSWFGDTGKPFSWWIGPGSTPSDLAERLIAHGLVHVEDEAGMILDLGRFDPSPTEVAGVDVRRVRTAPELFDLATTVAANWDPPDQAVIEYYRRAAPVVLAPASPCRFWVAYVAGQAVAACESYLGAGVAGVYAVVTRQPYRQRGIGTAVTLAALRQARDEGFRIATLQASAQGRRIYERIGFITCGVFREFKPVEGKPAPGGDWGGA